MIDINKLFFELIRVALGNAVCLSHTPTAEEWHMLYEMAKKQSLVGICFAGVQCLQRQMQCPPEQLYLQWMGMAAKIQQRNEIVNRQCVELQSRLADEGFKSCILKGQGNAENYGQLAILRQSGDIDIWIEGGFEKVNAYVQLHWATCDINDHHIHAGIYHDTDVEVHYIPFLLNNPIKNKVLIGFFKQQEAVQFTHQVKLPSGDTIIAADNHFNLVFQMVHIYHHLFTEGIGLRQLMDYYFVIKHEIEVKKVSSIVIDLVEVQEAKKVISDLGLNRFASALMWVLGKVFGLERDSMLWVPNEKDGKFLLKEIMMAGNFGHQDERIPKQMSYWKSFWYLNFYNLRLIRFDYWSWFWTPIMRIKGFARRKINGYK